MSERSLPHELVGHDAQALPEFWVLRFFSFHGHNPPEVLQVVYLSFYLPNEMYKFIQFSFHVLALQNCIGLILMIHDIVADGDYDSFDHILGLTARMSLRRFLRGLYFSLRDFPILCSSLF